MVRRTPATEEATAVHAPESTPSVPEQPAISLSAAPVVPENTLPPPEPPDVWDELRAGMRLTATEHPRIEPHLRWFQRHPDYIDRVFERGEPYLAWIVQEVKSRNIPTEVALLPVVESGFNPFAYSHGRAAGLWQFIPGTGRRFGLQQNWWYDGRRDVTAATRAALDYLTILQRHFDGDWLLALAAYNAGEGTVLRAVRRNRRQGKPEDFWSLDLPRETRAYVPKLVALSRVIQSPRDFGIKLPAISAESQLREIDTGGQIDLALAAEMAGIPLETLYRYNPGYNRWATSPDGPHRLVLPSDCADTFAEALAALPAEKRINWIRYRIQSGETLSHIARRHHTTVALLQEVNDLPGNSIRAGHYLIIPQASRALDEYTFSKTQREQRLINRNRRGQKTLYTVKSGDTLWDIARAHQVSTRTLAKWNGMAPGDTLRPGKELAIWSSSAQPANPGKKLQRVRYTVRKGDSLARISQRFRVSIRDLKRWNQLSGKKYLQPGQTLTLYVDVRRQSGSG